MGKKSKSSSNAPVLLAAERRSTGMGTLSTRIGTLSQLPFGYCALSNAPTDGDAVCTPSGRIYRREAILAHLLEEARDIREKRNLAKHKEFNAEQQKQKEETDVNEQAKSEFRSQHLKAGISTTMVDNAKSKDSGDYTRDTKRRKLIDDSTDEERFQALQQVSVWLPQSSKAYASVGAEIRQRPTSPHSKQPLRVKDLVPLKLTREVGTDGGNVQYQCSVSHKTITAQPCVVIKNSGTVMLASVAEQLAYPECVCPLTGKAFNKDKDVLQLRAAATAFSASGKVESKQYKPNMI